MMEIAAWSCDQFLNCRDTAKTKKIPEIKASLDKNNSQRMGQVSIK